MMRIFIDLIFYSSIFFYSKHYSGKFIRRRILPNVYQHQSLLIFLYLISNKSIEWLSANERSRLKPKPCHAYCCLNTSKIRSPLDPAIHTGTPIIGCMAQTTNISSSADSQSVDRSMASSEDEDDINNKANFRTASLDMNFSTKNDVIHQCTRLEINQNDSDSISTDLSQSTATTTSQNDACVNLSTSSSEASLSRPLLNPKLDELITYAKETKVPSPANSNESLTSNYYSSIKFYFIDMFMSAFFVTPLVNIHWRGAWDLLDGNLLPSHERISALISLITGLIILCVIYLTQCSLQNFYEKHRTKIIGHCMVRLYTLIVAFAYINQWRGLWNMLDFTSNEWYFLLIETLVSITILVLMNSVYGLNSAPFLTGVDTDNSFILGSKVNISTNRFCQYIFDFVFYEIVEAPLIVIAWRGLYNLSDLFIEPDNKPTSMLISFVAGYSSFFLLALMQIPIVLCLFEFKNKWIHLIVSNTFHLIAFIGVVQIWRSLWMMCEQYIDIPNYHQLTLWLCYFGAYFLLTCGLTACSLNGPGGGKDNFIDNQPITLYNFNYFSTLFNNQSNYVKINRNTALGPESPSVETIVSAENPYRFEPP